MQNKKEVSRSRVDSTDRLVSQKLKMRRMILGLSQNDISKAIEVSVQQVQKYEKAINRISSGRLHCISKFLRVPISYFFEQANDDAAFKEALKVKEDQTEYDSANINGKKANTDNISEKEIFSLVKAFSEIKSSNSRKKIIELAKTLN